MNFVLNWMCKLCPLALGNLGLTDSSWQLEWPHFYFDPSCIPKESFNPKSFVSFQKHNVSISHAMYCRSHKGISFCLSQCLDFQNLLPLTWFPKHCCISVLPVFCLCFSISFNKYCAHNGLYHLLLGSAVQLVFFPYVCLCFSVSLQSFIGFFPWHHTLNYGFCSLSGSLVGP